MALRTVTATRYVTPLREGGSLPGLVEADDDGLYVLKFRGAGQGVKALVAELVAGELGRVRSLRFGDIAQIEHRLRWPLRSAVLRVRGTNGRRHAFAGLRPDTAALISRHIQTAAAR